MNTETLSSQLPSIPPFLAAWILLDELPPETLADISEQVRVNDWSSGTRQEWRERLAYRIALDGLPFSSVFEHEFNETLEPYFQRLFSRESRVRAFLSSSKLFDREEQSVSLAFESLGVRNHYSPSPSAEAIARQIIRSELLQAHESAKTAAYVILDGIDWDPEFPEDLDKSFNRKEERRAARLMRFDHIERDLEILTADVYLPAMRESKQFFTPEEFSCLVREVYEEILAQQA